MARTAMEKRLDAIRKRTRDIIDELAKNGELTDMEKQIVDGKISSAFIVLESARRVYDANKKMMV